MRMSRDAALRLILRDKGTKALSLLLAVITWYAVRGVIGVTKVVHGVPIVVQVKEGIAVLSQSEKTAVVTFKGSQAEIEQLDEPNVRESMRVLVVSRGKDAAGRETIPLHPRNVEGVRGARSIRINRPGSVTIELDEQVERLFLVKARYRGKPDLGQVVSVVPDPPYVRVRGPKTKLSDLKDQSLVVLTGMVDVDRATGSFQKIVPVLSPSDEWVSRVKPSDVLVSVNIERKPASKAWSDVPVSALVPQSSAVRADVRPARVNVVLTGRSELLESITERDFKVFVNCVGLDMSAPYELPLVVHIADEKDVSWAVEPDKVQVMLREAH